MAIKKNFLRITSTWSELFTPGEYDHYVSDLSGTPALFYISDTQLDPTTIAKGWFTLGGNIGQMRLLSDKYIYAKADIDDPAGFITIITAHEHLPVNDVDDVRDQVNDVIEQIMGLTERVTTNTISIEDHAVEYELLLRQIAKQDKANAAKFKEHDENLQGIHDTLDKHRIEYLNFFDAFAHTTAVIEHHLTTADYNVVDLWNKLHAAETLVMKYRADYKMLSVAIKNLEIGKVTGADTSQLTLIQSELASLTDQLGEVSHDMDTMNLRVNVLEKNADTGDKYDFTNDIAEINNKFASVNNALAKLSALDENDAVEATFKELEPNLPNDLKEATAAIKDLIVKTNDSNDLVSNLDTKIANTTTVSKLNNNVDAANSTLKALVPLTDADDIEAAFNKLIATIPDDMKASMTSLKDIIVRTSKSENFIKNANYLKADDQYIVDPDKVNKDNL